jgi:hypothetical protein
LILTGEVEGRRDLVARRGRECNRRRHDESRTGPAGCVPGLPRRPGDFLLALALHNDRDSFQSHRAEHEEGWGGSMAALLGEVRVGLRGACRGVTMG